MAVHITIITNVAHEHVDAVLKNVVAHDFVAADQNQHVITAMVMEKQLHL